MEKETPKIKKFEFKLKFNLKNILLGLLIGWIVLSLLFSFFSTSNGQPKISLSQALNDIKDKKVKLVEVEDSKLTLTYNDGTTQVSKKETGVSFTEVLKAAEIPPESVNVVVKELPISQNLIDILSTVLPLGLTALFFYFIFKQAKGAQDSVFSFGRSTARLFAKGKQTITFKNVAGVEEAKKELEEIVDFLKHPQKYHKLGARTPKGVLLIGPSGTGKTLLAKAVAGEAGVPFFSMAGSEFMEMLIGVGASRVRDLFSNAKKAAPAIIFIDEIDAIGRQRGLGFVGGHDEREQTLNQILVEMDGFTPNDAVLVVAATNRGDLLDPALLRPGRFDRKIELDLPDIVGRKAILAIHAQGKPFAPNIDWEKVSKRTVMFSGADLENTLNEAAILAARNDKKQITMADIEEAATRVKLGPEKKRVQTEMDKKMTAYHEAGHALAAYYSPHMDPIHRVSIVSRTRTLGVTEPLPEKDRLHETRSNLLDRMVTTMGGRAAEELIFKELTTGAANDIVQATRIARLMVAEFGMSKLGPTNFGPQTDMTEWGRGFMEPTTVSPVMQDNIDQEIKNLIDSAYKKALEILKKNRKKLDLIAAKLIEQETIEGEEFQKLMKK